MIISDRRQVIFTAGDRSKAEAALMEAELKRIGYDHVYKTYSTTQIILDAEKDIDDEDVF